MNQELRQKKWKVCWQDVVVQPVVATSISPRQIAQESMVAVGGTDSSWGWRFTFYSKRLSRKRIIIRG
jgi:hypothetical protein